MSAPSGVFAVVTLVTLAAASVVDMQRVEARTLVIYTTPALQDFLEKEAIPTFTRLTGIRVQTVYLNAAQEYYRLRLSPERPEADVFLHASPLFLEKGYEEAHLFDPFVVPDTDLGIGNQSRAVQGGRIWTAFAWSPLVEVYDPDLGQAPDLLTDSNSLGYGHPLLSNNGVYVVLFLEAVDPAAGQSSLERIVVQPSNARAIIQGVADGSYEVTLGYEALVGSFKDRGARISYDVPLLNGERVTTPVLFSAAMVEGSLHEGGPRFVNMLYTNAMQERLGKYGMRSVDPGVAAPEGHLDLSGVRIIQYDWSKWRELETALPLYEVKG